MSVKEEMLKAAVNSVEHDIDELMGYIVDMAKMYDYMHKDVSGEFYGKLAQVIMHRVISHIAADLAHDDNGLCDRVKFESDIELNFKVLTEVALETYDLNKDAHDNICNEGHRNSMH